MYKQKNSLMSLENWWRMAYAVYMYHAPIQMTSQIYHHSYHDATLISKLRHQDDIMPMDLVKHLIIL